MHTAGSHLRQPKSVGGGGVRRQFAVGIERCPGCLILAGAVVAVEAAAAPRLLRHQALDPAVAVAPSGRTTFVAVVIPRRLCHAVRQAS